MPSQSVDADGQNREIVPSLGRSAPSPTFVILIPTFNGTHFLRRALVKHADIILANGITDVDIVVSDNGSGPETEQIVRRLMEEHSFIKYVRQPRHYDTAEEHLFEALKAVNYDYVWTFGDDDVPLPDALPRLLALARTGRYGCIMGNLRAFLVSDRQLHPGRTSLKGLVRVDSDQIGSISDIISGVGFQTVAACMSVAVVRREDLIKTPLKSFLGASPIYAHVAAYLHAFASRTSYFIAEPIVDYRTGATTEGNWERFAKRRLQSVNHPWTSGVMNLISLLIEEGRVPPSFLSTVHEHAYDAVFYLWGHVLHRMILDFEEQLTGKGTPHRLPESAIADLCMALSVADDPLPLELAEQLRRLISRIRAMDDATGIVGVALPTDALTAQYTEAVRGWVLQQAAELRAAIPAPDQQYVFSVAPVEAQVAMQDWGEEVLFSLPESEPFVVEGFSEAEPWGRWTDGQLARLQLSCPSADRDVVVRLTTPMAFTREGRCEVEIWVNDAPRSRFDVTAGGELRYRVDREHLGVGGRMVIHLHLLDAKRALDEPRAERRALGVGIGALRIDPVPDA